MRIGAGGSEVFSSGLLQDAGLVRDRRSGVASYNRFDEATLDPAQRSLWQALSAGSDDPLLRQDAMRVAGVLAMRAADQNWADSVAGDMERHYSPGRTDRKRVVEGKSVSVRVDLGGRRNINKKTHKETMK